MFEGGCFCGAIHYSVSGSPKYVNHCHCSMCRRASGALFVSWATVDRSAFVWKTDEPSYFRSSQQARRSFCSKCGTSLTWESYADGRLTGSIDLAIGSLDDPNAFSPAEHIWAAEQVGCLRFADGLPRRAGDTKSDLLPAFKT